MKINLPTKSFAFFKVISGFFLLFLALFFPVASFILMVIIICGKAHTLGAWISIWKAGKFNWTYFFWIFFFIVVMSFWGVKAAPFYTLAFINYTLFAFHFIFDEFDLQEEKRNIGNVVSSLTPFFLLLLYLIKDFTHISISLNIFIAVTLCLWVVEILNTKEINWFTINTKILSLFVLASLVLNIRALEVLNIILVFHYIFWFIYPVYKLHKYKREERDGFIMILLVIMTMSIFVYSTRVWAVPEAMEIGLRTVYIASIVHFLTTAPFGYLFGLPRPKYYN